MESASALKAVTLTHVRYQRGDQIGHFLAWVSLVPVFISLGGFAAHILFRRELQTISFAAGLVVSQLVNEVVKSSVKQSRPESCAALESCESHGWPSSHAQYMFFFATYFTLLSFKSTAVWGPVKRSFLNALHWTLAALTMCSRVYLGYHSVAQVIAGAALGAALGAAWYWLVNYVLHDHFPAVEDCAVGKWLCLKDTSHIPNVLQFEYDNARAARRALLHSPKSD